MFKKLISTLLISVLAFPYATFALPDDYKQKIDAVVDRLSIEQLHTLDTKIEKINESDARLSLKNRDILAYIEESIEQKLIAGSALQDSEHKAVSSEIIGIQDALMDSMESNFETLLGEYEKLLYVRETGDFSFTVDINHEEIGEVQAGIELNNYDAVQNYLDSQISTDMKAFMKVDVQEETMEIDMSGFMDYITKDGNMYVLLDKLSISGEGLEEIQDMIDELKAIADQKSYIHIPTDASYEEGLAFLENLKPSIILADMNRVFDKPLLRAHSKRGDKYILVPTKYACDQGKIIGERFDPFYGSEECSDGQYRDLVEDFLSDDGHLYMKLGTETTLGLMAQDYSSNTTAEMTFNGSRITSMEMRSTPKNKQYEGFTLSYEQYAHLNISLYNDEANIVWTSALDRTNNLNYANLNIDIEDYGTKVSGKLELQNKAISGYLDVSGDGEKLFYMTTAGSYKQGYLDMTNNFELFENPFESSIDVEYVDEEIPGADCYESYYEDTQYVCYIEKEPSGDTLSGVWNFTADTRYSKNNLEMIFQAFLADDEIIKAEMINTAKREFKKIDIETPTNTTPYDEVFEDEYLY